MANWFAEQRIAWIIETAAIYGFINRIHIQRKFGVSTPQASADLKAAAQRRPGQLIYDAALKHYKYREEPTP